PPCCTTSRHPTPQRSTGQPHHSQRAVRETAGMPAALPVRTRLATSAGLAVAGLSRRIGAGEGSVIGGRVLLAVDPGALERLAAGRTIALISGTNGKTTTTSMLAALEGAPSTAVVANADDPLIVWAAGLARQVSWVGTGHRWRLDAYSCPNCGEQIEWDDAGHWACTNCSLARPSPHLALDGDDVVLADGRRIRVALQLPGWP